MYILIFTKVYRELMSLFLPTGQQVGARHQHLKKRWEPWLITLSSRFLGGHFWLLTYNLVMEQTATLNKLMGRQTHN